MTSTHATHKDHWPALDGLRGVACLAVMIYHFVPFVPQRTSSAAARTLDAVAHTGWVGVDLFFVLSGFLITGILLRAKGEQGFLRNFYARRVLRIFPLYYLVLLTVLVIGPLATHAQSYAAMADTLHHQGWLWAYAYNLRVLFTGRFWADGGIPLSHCWSLSIEEHFYLVWPLVVAWADRRTLLRISVTLVLLVPVARTVAVLAGASHAILYTFTLCRMDALLLGAFVALTFRDARVGALLRRLAPATLLACGAGFLSLVRLAGDSSGLTGPMLSVGFSVLAFGSAAIVVLATVPEATPLARLLAARPLRWFGRYSYGAYLLHFVLRPAILKVAAPERLEEALGSQALGIVAHVLIGIAVTMTVAVAAFHLFEMPFLRLKRFFEYGATAQVVDPSWALAPIVPLEPLADATLLEAMKARVP
jgi:peptidoglycan/LPS O-acetylase OafA/YrhL